MIRIYRIKTVNFTRNNWVNKKIGRNLNKI